MGDALPTVSAKIRTFRPVCPPLERIYLIETEVYVTC